MVDYFSLALAHGLLLLALWRLVLRPDLDDETQAPSGSDPEDGKKAPQARRGIRQASSSTSQ